MAVRFRKRKKIGPGMTLNLGKRSASLSFGRRGASLNVGQRGVMGTISVLGTGLSYVTRLGRKRRR
jgi:hypothetical protein